MKKWKKLLAIAISLIMVVGMFSATVFATTTSPDTGCPLIYHIYYNGNGSTSGSQSDSTGYDWETITVKNQGTLQKTGNTFTGWNTAANGSGDSYAPGDSIGFIIVSEWIDGYWTTGMFGIPYYVPGYWHIEYGSRTLYAQWTINAYNVTFKTTTGGTINGGTSDVVANNVAYGTSMSTITPTVAADEGYSFTGWTPSLPSTVTAAGTYTATFTINTYDVTFKTTTGGTIDGGTADIVKKDVDHGTQMSTIAPAAVADHGYTFDGWSPALPATVTTAATYTAQFTINQYTMTFNSMGGSAVAPITQNYNTQIAKPENPAREHYTFVGWYDSEDNPISFPYTITDNITVYAKWQINSYTMIFDSEGGSSVTPVRQEYGTQVTKPADPTRYGFTFSGWYTGENGTGTVISFPYTLTGDITVHAKWTAGTYTMTFDSEGGSAVASISGDFGDYVSTSEVPTKAGYTFEGWYSNPGGTGSKITFPYNLTGNVTVYAKWSEIEVVSEPSMPSVASTTTVSETPTPTNVPSMGAGNRGTAIIAIGIFSMLSLACIAVLGNKKRRDVK